MLEFESLQLLNSLLIRQDSFLITISAIMEFLFISFLFASLYCLSLIKALPFENNDLNVVFPPISFAT